MLALYVRTSTDRQAGGAESQAYSLKQWAVIKGISSFEVYEDLGVSGAKASRPALDRMMEAVRAGQITTVAVFALSRMARSTKHLLAVLEELRERNVAFVSITENVDTSSAMGTAIVTIISALNQLERALIRERVISGLARVKAQGKLLGRPRTCNVSGIVDLSLKGMSQREIAKILGCSKATVMRVQQSRDKSPKASGF